MKKQHEFAFAMRRATEPHLVNRTPDDALRYQSVMFALIRALDKVRLPPHDTLLSDLASGLTLCLPSCPQTWCAPLADSARDACGIENLEVLIATLAFFLTHFADIAREPFSMIRRSHCLSCAVSFILVFQNVKREGCGGCSVCWWRAWCWRTSS